MIRLLICDDHEIVRQAIRQTLADAGDIGIVGEAENGSEALCKVRAAVQGGGGVDVVLMDIAMPYRDGLHVLKQLKSECPKLPVLMLSSYPDKQYAVRSMKLGAAGYLNKSADAEQMAAAVRTAARGGLFVTPAVAERLAVTIDAREAGDARPLQERLSQREYQVYRLLSQGANVDEIAARLAIAPHAVSSCRARVLESTGARNDVELALYAVRQDSMAVQPLQ